MSQEAYDIVIVGAGAAGCIVASYLAEHTDASIALIEAGDMDRDPFIHIPAGFANMLVHDRHVWKYETVPQHGTGWRRGNRSHEARKRHENHGDCRSPRVASLGQHACGQPSRSPIRFFPVWLATRRHRDDRAAPRQSQQAAYARSKTAKPLHASLAGRTLLCVDPMAAPHPRPLGVLHPELPRIRPARLPRYPLQTILR
jgi:hypothetical protein